MPTELDDLFEEASPPPGDQPDTARLWGRGRRRRRVRQASAVLSSVAVIAAVGVAAMAIDGVRTPTVDTAAAPEAEESPEPVEEPVEVEPPYEVEREPNELAEVVVPDITPEPRQEDEAAAEEQEAPADEAPSTATGPQPDASRVADPCAGHSGGEPVAFIDVVAPVGGQQVTGSVDLVGCASVFEGTVRYRLTGPGGSVLTDSFTTASAGGPEVGEFRETLSTGGSGQHVLEVFWESPADGAVSDRSTVTFDVG